MNDLNSLKTWLEDEIDDCGARIQFAEDEGDERMRTDALAQRLAYDSALRKVKFLISQH